MDVLRDYEHERDALWEFFDAWVFFHAVKLAPKVSQTLDRTRQEAASQMLIDAANKVRAVDGRPERSH